jgi:hypothetical protein
MFLSSLRKKQILPLATVVYHTSVVNELAYFNVCITRAYWLYNCSIEFFL